MVSEKVTGIILAGGKSRRMGAEKGLVRFHGRPLISYAIEALMPHCDEILISANSTSFDHFGFRVIPDEIPGSGPMGGIWSCLKQSSNEVCVVLSCDTPLVDQAVIDKILRLNDDFDVAVPWHRNAFYEPLCAAYHKRLLPVFGDFLAEGNFKIPDLIEKVNSRTIPTGPEGELDSEVFYNVNSRKDLQVLQSKNLTGLRDLPGLSRNNTPEVSPQICPNLLLIAGTGRKVGKTTLACRLIKKVSKAHQVVGIKVSPHMHRQAAGQKVIAETKDYLVIEETNPDNGKDSSRMLRAGARQVFYLQTRDRHIAEPFEILMKLIPESHPVVCESGALLSHARPGLFLLVKREGQTAFKKGVDQLSYKTDHWVVFDGEEFNPSPEEFIFDSDSWKITG
ncbi:MAG: NTP transferase domain-containing protein [Bacteroidales bacterium]